jgi:hypothetical protein
LTAENEVEVIATKWLLTTAVSREVWRFCVLGLSAMKSRCSHARSATAKNYEIQVVKFHGGTTKTVPV